jgi:hypothetical protein
MAKLANFLGVGKELDAGLINTCWTIFGIDTDIQHDDGEKCLEEKFYLGALKTFL